MKGARFRQDKCVLESNYGIELSSTFLFRQIQFSLSY